MKIQTKGIKAELEKLYNRHKKITVDIDCLTYEKSQLEEAMIPLKEAYDKLTNMAGGEEEKLPKASRSEGAPKREMVYKKEMECEACGVTCKIRGPRQRFCPDCGPIYMKNRNKGKFE